MQNYKDLKVWEKALYFTLMVYHQTKFFPGKKFIAYQTKYAEQLLPYHQILQKVVGKYPK